MVREDLEEIQFKVQSVSRTRNGNYHFQVSLKYWYFAMTPYNKLKRCLLFHEMILLEYRKFKENTVNVQIISSHNSAFCEKKMISQNRQEVQKSLV